MISICLIGSSSGSTTLVFRFFFYFFGLAAWTVCSWSRHFSAVKSIFSKTASRAGSSTGWLTLEGDEEDRSSAEVPSLPL